MAVGDFFMCIPVSYSEKSYWLISLANSQCIDLKLSSIMLLESMKVLCHSLEVLQNLCQVLFVQFLLVTIVKNTKWPIHQPHPQQVLK